MQSADEPTDTAPEQPPDTAARSPISVAILAAIACVPIVVATGFLTDRPADRSATTAIPGDISPLAFRGAFDAAPGQRSDLPMRAGY